jgi:CUG-BP- and ETR3-like factor
MEDAGTEAYAPPSDRSESPSTGKKAADAIKLFIGQVPKTFEEEDLQTYFIEFGAIHELRILRHRFTNEHKGTEDTLQLSSGCLSFLNCKVIG